MRIISVDKAALVLSPNKPVDESQRGFLFDIGIVPDRPKPARLVIQRKQGAYLLQWSMSWSKFMRESCIDTIALIDKSHFSYKAVKYPARSQRRKAKAKR